MGSRPLADGLFRDDGDRPRLIGGRRRSDGKYAFPMPQGALAAQYDTVELASEGLLWSFTVQRFRPKTPFLGAEDAGPFVPYAVGYVELPGQIIVEGRIRTDDLSSLKIGMPMRLTVFPFHRDPDGTEVTTYGFEAA